MDTITVIPPKRGVDVVDAHDLLAAAPPQRWLVDGLIPAETVGDLFGPPGDGKSSLALDLALVVASGAGSWFGLKCAPGRAIVLDGERGAGPGALARDLHRAAQGRRPGRGQLIFPRAGDEFPPLWEWDRHISAWCPTDWCQTLTAWLAASPPALVVIDTLISMASGLDVLDVAQGYALGRTLRRWAKAIGGPVVLTLSHTNQSSAKDDLAWRLHWLSRQGSSGYPGAIRWAAGVSRLRADDHLAKALGLAERAAQGRLIAVGVSKANEMGRAVWSDVYPAIFEMRPDGGLVLVKDGREAAKACAAGRSGAKGRGKSGRAEGPAAKERKIEEMDCDEIPF